MDASKLSALQTELVKVLLSEADSTQWPGMATPQDRGDRLWCKRNAIATATLLARLSEVRSYVILGFVRPANDGELQREIEEANKQAANLLKAARVAVRGKR